jgi:hypothetical protein
MRKKELQRCSSGGGPVIGVPAELAGKWRGTLAPIGAVVPAGWSWGTPGGPVCDYDRACDKIEHRVAMRYGGFGSVPLDGGLALVFEGPLNTTWIPTDEGGVVVRNAPDEMQSLAELVELVAAVPAAKWKRWPGRLTLRDGRIFFWDSAMEGADNPKAIPARDGGVAVGNPGPGTYAISTAVHDVETYDDELHIEYAKLTRV